MAAVVATVPAAKAPRKLPKEGLHPDGRAMRRMERDAEERIYQALQKWGRSLFRGVTAESVALLVARLDDPEFNKPMRDAMIAVLQEIAAAGADFGRQQVERGVFGIKRTARIDADSVDWTAANDDALRWAIEYGYNLIRGITDTTRRMIANEIRYFVDNGITINQLRDRLMSGNLFSRNRASMIAVTETTRAYAEGNTAAWRASGVIEGREWQTAVDELVCPLCGPLHGKIAKMGESFGPVMNPPRHVNCRCWILPVVIGDTEVLSEVGVGPWGNAGAARRPAAVAPVFTNIGEAREWLNANGIRYADSVDDIIDLQWERFDGAEPSKKDQYYKNWRRILRESEASEEYRLRAIQAIADAKSAGRIGNDIAFIFRKPIEELEEKWYAGLYKEDIRTIVMYDRPVTKGGRLPFGNNMADVATSYANDTEGLVVHEYGHHYAITVKPEVQRRADIYMTDIADIDRQWVKINISYYAKTNALELAAEAYTMKMHPDFLSLPPNVIEFIDALLGMS